MSDQKLLIDTNVFIALEDPKAVAPSFAELVRKCGEHSVRVFIHEEALRDINRDTDVQRRNISLSKLNKFQLLKSPSLPSREILVRQFGNIRKPNDEVDVALIYALDINAVDLLITEDKGIHDRVRFTPLADRILTVADALLWLRQTYDPTPVVLPLVEDTLAHQIDFRHALFDSLREDYAPFDEWWRAKCVNEHRHCWTLVINDELAGLIVRKDENFHPLSNAPSKVLKICTFKVGSQHRGERLGELLLKQALWFAQRNAYDLIYLTTFPQQTSLIDLLEFFGFKHTSTAADGEMLLEKEMLRTTPNLRDHSSAFVAARINYPRFLSPPDVAAFTVPIQGDYHRKLFPEIAFANPLPLFPDEKLLITTQGNRTPGNTIRKVYLCRARTKHIKSGDLLVFYQSHTKGVQSSQAITSIGVVERLSETGDLAELVHLTAKRSVFTEEELREMIQENPAPVRVIDFLLVGHFEKPILLSDLLEVGVFKRHPPQSIAALKPEQYSSIKTRLNLGFEQ